MKYNYWWIYLFIHKWRKSNNSTMSKMEDREINNKYKYYNYNNYKNNVYKYTYIYICEYKY